MSSPNRAIFPVTKRSHWHAKSKQMALGSIPLQKQALLDTPNMAKGVVHEPQSTVFHWNFLRRTYCITLFTAVLWLRTTRESYWQRPAHTEFYGGGYPVLPIVGDIWWQAVLSCDTKTPLTSAKSHGLRSTEKTVTAIKYDGFGHNKQWLCHTMTSSTASGKQLCHKHSERARTVSHDVKFQSEVSLVHPYWSGLSFDLQGAPAQVFPV